MNVGIDDAKLALRLLVEGNSVRFRARLDSSHRPDFKRLNRLTYSFSKKLRNLEAAFAMFAAYYNYCWRTRRPGKSGKLRPTAAMMAGLANHTWSFDELFQAVLA
jgi:hypothetical protein